MVRLREIPRTATFAWSPDANAPWIATGTKSGAVDVDFSNETCLELWDLALDSQDQSQELRPSVTLPTETGFHDLAWTLAEDHKRGIIAGALDNGTLGLWDADGLFENASTASISQEKVHSGAIKALQFNPKIPNFVATGGAKGELFVSDLNNPGTPIRLGSTAARADDIDCLDWNKRVSNILVTGSTGGFVTVWDMKTKKESLTLNNSGRKAVSAIAWDPTKPTRLITAVPLEQEPVILVWDLRNSNAPERTLRGHDNGVLSLSWCQQDSDLLLSCGKDNRTILWNPQTGQSYGDYPVVTNWTFQTRWNPHNPNFFATASFDGKVQIQTIQNTNPGLSQEPVDQAQATDEERSDEDDDDGRSSSPMSGTGTPDPAKMTKRQRGQESEHLISLDMGPQQRKFFTDAEKAMKKDEHARKRKELTKRKIQEEKAAALNRLLKPQAGKSRGAAPKPETLANLERTHEAAMAEEEEPAEKPNRLYTRWVNNAKGVSLAVPEEWEAKYVGEVLYAPFYHGPPPLPPPNGRPVQELD
ncbi:hypothetical protein DV735_g4444, partial [Chaetothyriales sp. CBS 134920]